jgi:hypothetical protein
VREADSPGYPEALLGSELEERENGAASPEFDPLGAQSCWEISVRSCYFICAVPVHSAAFTAAASCVKLHSAFSQVLSQLGFGTLAIEVSYGYFEAYFFGANRRRGCLDGGSPSG